jgi:CRISPR/Cas system CSM-associated protein Csm5 (group 7 of RAMP superfamily)
LDKNSQFPIIEVNEINQAHHSGISLRSLPEGKLKMWQAGSDGLLVFCDYMVLDNEDVVIYLSDIEKFVSNLVDFTSKYYSMFHSEEPKTLFTISCELSSDLSTIKLDNQMTIKKNVKALGSIQLEVENLIENPQENSKKLFHKIIESVNFSDK